jgi:hypothetical protein
LSPTVPSAERPKRQMQKIKAPIATFGLERKNLSFKKKNPKITKRTGKSIAVNPKYLTK